MKKLNTHYPVPRQMAAAIAIYLAMALVVVLFFGLSAKGAKAGPNDIGLVLDPGGPNDHSFNELSIQGLHRAETELGINGHVYPTTGPADYQAAFNQCVADGNALCFGVGFTLNETISNTAHLNPGVNFALLDFEWPDVNPNLRGINFNVEEAAYLAGILAGRMTDEGKIGAIGGMQIPPVDRFIDGYWYGARCANPAVTTWITYTNDFSNPGLGDTVARNMINHGADVIDGVAGSTGGGALLAAAELGKWAIGVDVDEYYTTFMGGGATGSDRLLTSVMKRLDNAVYQTIQEQITGHFSGGNVWLGLAEDGVSLAPYHDASAFIPISVKNEITATRQALLNGNLNVYGPCLSGYEYDFTDYFDHASLTRETGGLYPLWDWINESESSPNWSLDEQPGFLRIRTQEGGIIGNSNSQHNLLMMPVPPGDFQVTTRLSINPNQNYQYGGVMVFVDDDNYIQINRAYVNGDRLNFDLEVAGLVTNTQITFGQDEVWLRIIKQANTYTGKYSQDGFTWSTLGEYVAEFDDPKVGLGAANNLDTADSVNADFAFIRVEGRLPRLHPVFDDPFNTSTLDSHWRWLFPNPSRWSLSARPGYLRIRLPLNQGGPENLLVQNAPASLYDMYDMTTSLDFAPDESYQIAGLTAYIDAYNNITLGRVFCTPDSLCVGNGIHFDGMLIGYWNTTYIIRVKSQGMAHLRIFREGYDYFGLYSPGPSSLDPGRDGMRWFLVGKHTLVPEEGQIKIGLQTYQDMASADIPADFDYFHLWKELIETYLPVLVKSSN